MKFIKSECAHTSGREVRALGEKIRINKSWWCRNKRLIRGMGDSHTKVRHNKWKDERKPRKTEVRRRDLGIYFQKGLIARTYL